MLEGNIRPLWGLADLRLRQRPLLEQRLDALPAAAGAGEVRNKGVPLGDKAGELSRDGRAARVDHHAADLAVEPVDGEDLLALPERAVVLAQQLRHAARRAVVLRENARGLDADDEVRVVIENGECFHRQHNQRRPRPR